MIRSLIIEIPARRGSSVATGAGHGHRPRETAAGNISTDVPIARAQATVADVLAMLRQRPYAAADTVFAIGERGHRLPWLLFGLAGSMAAAALMSRFERVLAEDLAVAFFVPAIVYLADASEVADGRASRASRASRAFVALEVDIRMPS